LIIFGLLIILIVVKQPAGIIGIIAGIRKRWLRRRRAGQGETTHGAP